MPDTEPLETDIGNVVKLATSEPFTDVESNTPTNPTSVILTVKRRDGSRLVYGWPAPATDGLLTHDDVGLFSRLVETDIDGTWYYRFAAPTGSVAQAARIEHFFVRPDPLLDQSASGGPYTVDTLAALTDVTLDAPQEGDTLIYSGGQWVNEAPATVDETTAEITDGASTAGYGAGDGSFVADATGGARLALKSNGDVQIDAGSVATPFENNGVVINGKDGARVYLLDVGPAGMLAAPGKNVTIGTLPADIFLRIDDTNFILWNLRTTDPHVANALWNDGGTLKVSAG